MKQNNQLLLVSSTKQELRWYIDDAVGTFVISTGLAGMGEEEDSGRTPRGWHKVYSIIGKDMPLGSVFVGRQHTGETYNPELGALYPDRDWILTRIIQLEGLEPGSNLGGSVDTLGRFIYIHGTAAVENLGKPASHGCIRMKNQDIIKLTEHLQEGAFVYIE